MTTFLHNRGTAAACILLAIFLACMQDGIVKGVSSTLPAYETIIFRTVVALPFLLAWLMRSGTTSQMINPDWRLLLLRSLILCSAYFAFVLSIAAMPIATTVSIYFTMPFIVAGFSGYMLGERVPLYRWIAITIGFIGVLVTVRPTVKSIEPGVFLALYAAFGYAWGQMLGRKLSLRVSPAVIANWQNLVYLSTGILIGIAVYMLGVPDSQDKSLAFLTRPWIWPSSQQFWLLIAMGLMSAAALVLFIYAYKNAEANFVAPFEYTAIIWATFNGVFFFGDFPDIWNLAGTATVIAAGLYMLWNDSKRRQTIG